MTRSIFPGSLLAIAAVLSLALPCAAEVSTAAEVAADAALTLVDHEEFEAEPRAGWSLPPGWTRAAFGNGFALQIAAAQAGLKSAAQPDGLFGDVVAEGQFTFTSGDGTAQLSARHSAAGAYVAQLDAAGAVMLEKRAGDGSAVSSWRAVAEPQAIPGSARTLQLSALGGALRVTVDGIDVLTANDAEPLPPGGNQIGAVFATSAGALEFDNYLVWVPSSGILPGVYAAPAVPSISGRRNTATATLQPALVLATMNEPASANDLFADRLVATGGRYVDIANNSTGSANESSEPVPTVAPNVTKTVWYEFTPPASRPYLLTTFGSSFNTVLAVYTGTWPALTEVAANDDVNGSLQARLTLSLDSTKTYYIQLGGRNGSGDFEFRIMDPADALVPSTSAISIIDPDAPTAPLADKGVTNLVQPVVAWTPRPTVTPYAYLAEVSTDSTFATLAASGVVEDPTHFWQIAPALNVPAQAAGQKYYWRVAALNFLGQTSTTSPAYSFTLDTSPPAPPALLSPTVNEVVATYRPTFKWQASSDATAYHVRIATNFSVTTIFGGNDVDVASPTYTPAADVPQGEYWWSVTSRDAAGNWSGYGEKRRFVINVSKTPASGTLVIPAGQQTTTNVTLTWTEIPGATYSLEVATDSSFTAFAFQSSQPLTTGSYTVTGLPFGSYYWRVIVNGSALPQSLARNFTVTPPLPKAPLIETTGALTDGASIANDTPTFDWTVPANWVPLPLFQSLTYELQLATDSGFTQLVVPTVQGIPTTDFQWNQGLTPNTTYYWRVRARTNLGLFSAYSPTYTFTYDTQPPAAPILIYPVNISSFTPPVVLALRPTIKWGAVKGAVSYHVKIATNFSGTGVVPGTDVFVNGTTFTPPADLALGQYWVFVESQDAAGNLSGTVSGQGQAFSSFRMESPASGTIFVPKTPANGVDVVFKWPQIPGVTTYRLEVSMDGDTSFTGSVLGFDLTGTTYTLKHVSASIFTSIFYWRLYPSGTTPPPGYYSSFAVLAPGAAVPSIRAEAGALVENDVTTSPTPSFAWTTPAAPDSGVYTYQLQVATDSKFAQLIGGDNLIALASNATTYNWSGAPLSPGTYYWRVRSVYLPSGVTPPFSKTYRFTVVAPSAAVPVLTSPAANTVSSQLRPTFKLNAVKTAVGYRVRISSDAAGAHPVPAGNDVELARTAFTPATDLPQGEYWVGVEAKDPQGDWSGFAEQRRFVVNYSQVPAEDAVVVAKVTPYTANVVLKWTKIPGVAYRVQVSTDANFTNPIQSPLLATDSTYTLANQAVGTYYWRLLVNGQALLPTALAHRFHVTPPLPAAPLIQTVGALPGAVTKGGVTNTPTPTFDWTVPANWTTPPPGASLTYELQVATDSKFAQLAAPQVTGIATSNYAWPMPLAPGTTYYWRVRAVTDLGLPGVFSPVYAFTVDTAEPSSAELKAPADFAVTTSARPAFSWIKGTNGATRYRFEISADSSFATPPAYTATVTTTSLTLPQSLAQGSYYWRVSALDPAGNETAPTAARTLTIDFRTTPAEGAEITAANAAGIPVQFKWVKPTAAPTGTTYTIEIDADLDGTAETTLPPVTALMATSAALPPGYYQYRLVVSNGLGTSDWREFVILPP